MTQPSKTLDLDVLNWTDKEQTFQVIIKRSGEEVVYDTEITIPAGETVNKTDILPTRPYDVEFSVKDGPTRNYNFQMGECDEQEITIIYQGRHGIDFETKKC